MQEPKIILFDLETIPNLQSALKVWPQLSQYPGKTLKATVTSIACAGWKVLGQDNPVHCINAWDFSRWQKNVNDDFSVTREIRKVLDTADAVVTHNGKRFDWKFLQTRLLFHKLPTLPTSIPHIDTCELARRNAYSFNNRLSYLGEWLINDRKLDHEGWDLWVKVHSKDPKALKKMTDYCKQDVLLLEKIFKPLKPFAKNIPNFNLYRGVGDKKLCPSCGSSRIRSNGFRATKTMTYRRYKCLDCGSSSRTDLKDLMPRSI